MVSYKNMKLLIKIKLLLLLIIINVHAKIATEDQFVALPEKVNHQDAVHLCQKQGMNLIKVQDDKTNEMVFNFAKERGLRQYWMDGNDRTIEGQWVYEDGSRIKYFKWDEGQPDNYHNNEDCLQESHDGNGFWNDISCDVKRPVICYRKLQKKLKESISEDQLFAIPNKVNHQKAVALCKEQGMNLIKISDEKSNELVYQFAVSRSVGQYWIDVNDRLYEGQWMYEDGNLITYSKWGPGEPNDLLHEDCAEGLFVKGGFWNDVSCNANRNVICYGKKPEINEDTKRKMIMEAQTVTKNLSIQLSQDLTTYDEAVQYCKNQDLRLIRIGSDEFNKWVYEKVAKMNFGTYWIDGNDRMEKDIWLDSDGKKLKYTNFKDGAVNNSNDAHCINGFSFKNEQWNVMQCNSKNIVICF